MTLHVTCHGTGKPIVLFHGWGFDSRIWHYLLPELSNYQVYLVDLPGFGLSSYMEWDQFKTELLNQLPQQFAVIGWSMGGLFATRLALEETNRVTHLMNITTSPYFLRDTNWSGIDSAVLDGFYQNLEKDPKKVMQDFMQLQLQKPIELTTAMPDLQALRDGIDVLARWDLREALVQIKIPVHYVFGRLDSIVSHRVMRDMQALYPEFEYTLIAKSAHAPFLSHMDEFLKIMKEFI